MYVHVLYIVYIVGGDEFVWPEEAGLPFSSDPNDLQRTQYVVCYIALLY